MSLPTSYLPVIRDGDGEHVGYLAPAGEQWQGLNLIGFALGAPADRESAQKVVVANGLASLDTAWWCRATKPFPSTEAELRKPGPDWPWRKVVIVEVSAGICTVRPALAWPEEATVVVRLTLPVDDLLRNTPAD